MYDYNNSTNLLLIKVNSKNIQLILNPNDNRLKITSKFQHTLVILLVGMDNLYNPTGKNNNKRNMIFSETSRYFCD